MVKKMRDSDSQEEIREAFHALDRHGTGEIGMAELRHMLRTNLDENLTDEEIEEMFIQAQTDGDKQISCKGRSGRSTSAAICRLIQQTMFTAYRRSSGTMYIQ